MKNRDSDRLSIVDEILADYFRDNDPRYLKSGILACLEAEYNYGYIHAQEAVKEKVEELAECVDLHICRCDG